MMSIRQTGNEVICQLDTDLVGPNLSSVRTEFTQLLAAGHRLDQFIVDCQKVVNVDALGIQLIVGLFRTLQNLKISLKLINCTDPVLRVLLLFRLNQHFRVEGVYADG